MRLLPALFVASLVPACSAILPYGHAFSAPGDFSPAQYAYIADAFPLFTVEKRHAYAVYGNASAPATSPARYNSMAASIGTARRIKALRASAKVLMYWNAALHWNFYECEADVRAAWLLAPSHGLDVPSYNYASAEFRAWWVACAVGALRSGAGALDGLFVDALPKLSWPGQPANAYALWGEMLDAVRAAVPGAFVIINADYDSPTGAVIANATALLAHADAVYAESMSGIDSPAAAAAPANTIAYLRFLETSSAAAAAAGKRFAGHGLLNASGATARSFTFGLALFLMAAPEPSTGFFLANDGYEVDQGLLAPHAEYALAFGAPRGPFTAAGAVLTRVFENATVVADLAARSATIVMGPPGAALAQ